MKRITKLYFLLLLAVFLLSLDPSRINVPILFTRQIKHESLPVYACLSSALPQDAYTLVFSQPDGTLDYGRYGEQFGFAVYQLVPRVLVAYRTAPVNIGEYPWSIAFNLPAEALDAILNQNSLEIVQSCDQTVVLRKIR